MEKITEFMRGRYGFDALDAGLLFISVLLDLISLFVRGNVNLYLSLAALIPIILCVVRFLSKNVSARQRENRVFLKMMMPIFIRNKEKIEQKEVSKTASAQDKKTYKFFKCPSCGQKVRVPRGKGKIEIICPNCRNKFIKKT